MGIATLAFASTALSYLLRKLSTLQRQNLPTTIPWGRKAKAEEVAGIMRDNMQKVMEREGKLGELEVRAETLQQGSEQFQKTSVKVKRQAWLQNMKMKTAIGGTVVAILVVLIIIFAS